MDVLTLAHGREDHLANLIEGLERSTLRPDCLVIAQMNQELINWQSEFFPVINCLAPPSAQLPLASARNLAAQRSTGDRLVYLDVDCIPSRSLLQCYEEWLDCRQDALLQGTVAYLPATDLHGWTEAMLETLGARHEVFNAYRPGDRLPHEIFWSLNFACTRRTFERIGGFDENYMGYGAEDTDFAFRAREAGVAVSLTDARAFHQHHRTCSPPLNHLQDIVRNAMTFFARWKVWPMEGWLQSFEEAGYIIRTSGAIEISSLPTSDEIMAARDFS